MRQSGRYFLVIGPFAVIVAAMVLLDVESVSERIGKTQAGINLRRLDSETIRISWGTGSGVNVSPEGALGFWGFVLESARGNGTPQELAQALPPLSPLDGVWMYLVKPERMGETVPAEFVNPKLDGAIDHMFHLIALGGEGNQNGDRITRLAARSYIYLGYVVLNESDVVALLTALADRSRINLEEDIETPERRLYRLRPGVEHIFADDPNDEKALADARRNIPIMYESINLDAGHPGDVMHVLYLDGHVEAIPYGERFPALPSFMDAFPPPTVSE
ncbi:MAG: hypothetical protein KF886_19050 [Candidatus Hydrogenedentes bacterium]|nr:hypothetical protein [Candidatus Hydrogenedentota bacterium]